MLNKDQYNQEEYNDYYRQETEGAEIKGSYKKEGNGKSIIILSTLLLLGAAGYFGFTQFKTSSEVETNEKEIKVNQDEEIVVDTKKEVTEQVKEETEKVQIKEKVSVTTATPDENIENNVVTAIEKSVSASQKMSPEEIAKVVQLVMSQMNQKNNNNTKSETSSTSENTTETVTNDTDLLNALSESMVDTITENEKTDYTNVEKNKNVEVKESKKSVDTYNKVTIQTTSGSDELSKLSEEISNVIQENQNTPTTQNTSTTYTESITKEVAERSNAMRIIIVKKGDTLGKIAKRAYGNVMDYKKIYSANPDLINRPDRIYIGQKLRIPE